MTNETPETETETKPETDRQHLDAVFAAIETNIAVETGASPKRRVYTTDTEGEVEFYADVVDFETFEREATREHATGEPNEYGAEVEVIPTTTLGDSRRKRHTHTAFVCVYPPRGDEQATQG